MLKRMTRTMIVMCAAAAVALAAALIAVPTQAQATEGQGSGTGLTDGNVETQADEPIDFDSLFLLLPEYDSEVLWASDTVNDAGVKLSYTYVADYGSYDDGGITKAYLYRDTDFTVSFEYYNEDQFEYVAVDGFSTAGTYKLTFEGIGKYTGSYETYEDVYNEGDVAAAEIDYTIPVQYSSTQAYTPAMTVKMPTKTGSIELVENKDYIVTFEYDTTGEYDYEAVDGVSKAGHYKIVVIGMGECSGELESPITVYEYGSLQAASVGISAMCSASAEPYDPPVEVSYYKQDGTSIDLEKGKDYKLSYTYWENMDARLAEEPGTVVDGVTKKGYYELNLSGNGDYMDSYDFGLSIDGDLVVSAISSQSYTGKAIEPKLTVAYIDENGSTELECDEDYVVAYKNNVNVGTATAIVTGIGVYAGMTQVEFAIIDNGPVEPDPIDISGAEVSAAGQTYTGSELKPAVSVVLDGKKLSASTDYNVSYANNTNAGTADVIVTGKGEYAGTAKGHFAIAKAANPLKLGKATYKVKLKKVKKKAQTVAGAKLQAKGQGKVTYSISKVVKAKFKKQFKINASTGKITVKKGTKKGSYKVTVKAVADGTSNYNAAAKTAVVTIKVN